MKATMTDKQCSRAGYLPVPLQCVPPQSLAELKIYLFRKGTFSLYTALENSFDQKDIDRLLESGVDFVYVSVKDHQAYYETIEKSITSIASDPNIQNEKKSEILYATSLELSNQLLAAPPGGEEISRTSIVAQATVQMILNNNDAFSRLYEVFNHDFYTASHLVNVCSLTIALAKKIGFADTQLLQQAGMGGLLHDIGKMFIPNDLLNTPKQLSDMEFGHIKKHVELGYRHLESVMTITPPIRSLVLEHHERLDGSGYPNGLRNSQISTLGQLAGIVDCFDAMTSVRPYRKNTFSIPQALERLEDDAHIKFDAEIIKVFASLLESAEITGSEKNNHNTGTRTTASNTAHLLNNQYLQYYFRIMATTSKVKNNSNGFILTALQNTWCYKLSCLGFGFLSFSEYKNDEVVLLKSPVLDTIDLDNLIGRVVHCERHLGGLHSVEARLLQPQNPAAVAAIKNITTVREVSALVEN